MKKTLFLCAFAISFNTFALEIDRAYQLIPHQQTTFLAGQSKIPRDEVKAVNRLLSLAELAMVERVNALQKGPKASQYFSRIDRVLQNIQSMEVTPGLQKIRQHIQTSIQQHSAYFELYEQTDKQSKAKQKQLVQSSHQHLITAYNLLMTAYPQETKHNKQAFFDYLCALDFI